MLEHLQKQETIQAKLKEYTPEQLDQVYLRVFNTDDGEMILKDLSNRCYGSAPTVGERAEGMRDVFVSIVSRLQNTVSKKREDKDEG